MLALPQAILFEHAFVHRKSRPPQAAYTMARRDSRIQERVEYRVEQSRIGLSVLACATVTECYRSQVELLADSKQTVFGAP